MAGLSDSITIGILLLLIFGAVSFYLYSRMSQTEKRLGLLENLLLTLKLSTEASLMGPDSVEPISSPAPLNPEDVDDVHEEDYAAMLKATSPSTASPSASASSHSASPAKDEADAEELLRSLNVEKKTSVDVNYESMSAKELKALVKERNLAGAPEKKREIIAFLKNNGVRVSSEEAAPQPLPTQPGDLDGGFSVELENGL
jgi:hypothetical protein